MIASVAVLVLIAGPANAATWTANPGASASNGIITLDNTGGGTSYETMNLDIAVANGDPISFEYRVTSAGDSTACSGGTPRVFLQGGRYNTHNGGSLNGGQTCASRTTGPDADGWYLVTGTIGNLGGATAGHVGLVNDHPGNVRTIEIRNLNIAGVRVFASTKDECKNDGWVTGAYKNQGDCVSSFAK